MAGPEIRCMLRARRRAAGLAQGQLAAQVGVSRQALSAIEAGRQVPSTTLALQLAQALGCAVDGLFSLPTAASVQVDLPHGEGAAPELGPGTRVVVARIQGRLVAHRARDHRQAADGIVIGPGTPEGQATVELLAEPAHLQGHVLVAGCAPLLGMLSGRLSQQSRDSRATWLTAHSAGALELLQQQSVHIAGLHFADAHDPEAHLAAAQAALPNQNVTLMNLAKWRQGLVVAPGNPKGIEPGAGLARPQLRWATRAPGAAAQVLLQRALKQAGLHGPLEPASVTVARDHAEVTQMVRWGVADVGVAIESAALEAGLDFIALAEERFDLAVASAHLDTPCVERFLQMIDRPCFRAEARHLPGYDLSAAGHVLSGSRQEAQL